MVTFHRFHLLRHAHSSWAVPGERDHERPLDERGNADIASISERVRDVSSGIQTIVCSSARRARQTLEGIRPALPSDIAIHISDDLYALGAPAYAAALRAHCVAETLLIGHNPSIEEFVRATCINGDRGAVGIASHGIGTAHWITIHRLPDAPDGTLRGYLHAVIRP
ncbi:histidine phosphatase family protein [Aureimonas sp. ME7]|uniref:SixA phosphatase family protein n=1 Tax=Aureimonas sp. ME7 TaxID=2744252 RepID=UPI0015F72654|nr:histidine phosphatase family protein [Aureimonas sp. ME7]